MGMKTKVGEIKSKQWLPSMKSGTHAGQRFATFYRPSKCPVPGLPLAVRSVGHYAIQGDWRDKQFAKYFVQVFWGVEGEGKIVLGEGVCRLAKGMVAVYFPGDTHRIQTTGSFWEYRWWTMDGLLAAEIARGFGLDNLRGRSVGTCPVSLLDEMAALVENSDPANELTAASLAYRLLGLAAGPRYSPGDPDADDLATRCKILINDNFHDPSLCVKWLAERLDVDRSHLCRFFRAKIGVPPSDYLQRVRMQSTFSLLKNSDEEIGVIATHVGIPNAAYFSRLVSASTGLPPRSFRARLRSGKAV